MQSNARSFGGAGAFACQSAVFNRLTPECIIRTRSFALADIVLQRDAEWVVPRWQEVACDCSLKRFYGEKHEQRFELPLGKFAKIFGFSQLKYVASPRSGRLTTGDYQKTEEQL
jgi:hypothetical protein